MPSVTLDDDGRWKLWFCASRHNQEFGAAQGVYSGSFVDCYSSLVVRGGIQCRKKIFFSSSLSLPLGVFPFSILERG